jgi:hypothetical protein
MSLFTGLGENILTAFGGLTLGLFVNYIGKMLYTKNYIQNVNVLIAFQIIFSTLLVTVIYNKGKEINWLWGIENEVPSNMFIVYFYMSQIVLYNDIEAVYASKRNASSN